MTWVGVWEWPSVAGSATAHERRKYQRNEHTKMEMKRTELPKRDRTRDPYFEPTVFFVLSQRCRCCWLCMREHILYSSMQHICCPRSNQDHIARQQTVHAFTRVCVNSVWKIVVGSVLCSGACSPSHWPQRLCKAGGASIFRFHRNCF